MERRIRCSAQKESERSSAAQMDAAGVSSRGRRQTENRVLGAAVSVNVCERRNCVAVLVSARATFEGRERRGGVRRRAFEILAIRHILNWAARSHQRGCFVSSRQVLHLNLVDFVYNSVGKMFTKSF